MISKFKMNAQQRSTIKIKKQTRMQKATTINQHQQQQNTGSNVMK